MTNQEIAIRFFLSLSAILVACRIVGGLARWIGQPQVVGEMIAGVLLGPSLFGWVAPRVSGFLFPTRLAITVGVATTTVTHPINTVLYVTAQTGLVLYIFCVGLEFNFDILRQRMRSALSVSFAGIAAPFALGSLLAWRYYDTGLLYTRGVTLPQAILFMGASISITAFPMLARIIYERGIAGTRLGTVALAAGSSDDAAAWCILAVVLASFKRDPSVAWLAIGGGVAYAVGVFTLVRPAVARLIARAEARGRSVTELVPFVMMLLVLGAFFTDYVGIYAVFGAFILGMALPRGELAVSLRQTIEPVTLNLFLPLFFVYSGLNTRLGLITHASVLGVALVILAVSCLAKFAACAVAARLNGESPRDSLAIGALMNARGLMELILLNIGLQQHLITPTFFTIMVMMAVVTTLLASPAFEWIYRRMPGELPSPIAVAPAT